MDLQGLKTYIRNVAQAAVTSSKTNLSTKKHGKTGMLISNFQRFRACNFIKIETPVQVFSFELCQIFKNIYFYKTSPAVASEVWHTWKNSGHMAKLQALDKKWSFPWRISYRFVTFTVEILNGKLHFCAVKGSLRSIKELRDYITIM